MSFVLRCDPQHGCGRALGIGARPMRLAAIIFQRSTVERELVLHQEQVAKRCRGCGIVSIFVPLCEGVEVAIV